MPAVKTHNMLNCPGRNEVKRIGELEEPLMMIYFSTFATCFGDGSHRFLPSCSGKDVFGHFFCRETTVLPRSRFVICAESLGTCSMVLAAWRNCARSRPRRDRSFGVEQVSPKIASYAPPSARLRRLIALFLMSFTLGASASPAPETWVPIRWTGGPLELAWRSRTKTLPTDASVRDALGRWYEPATLGLLENSSANCLLVTWSAPADAAVEAEQQQLVKIYTEAAHKRGLVVLGLVYAASDASKIAADAARAALDGLVLEGEFAPEFPATLRQAAGSKLVIEIAKDAARWRWQPATIVAIAGAAPSGRNLSEMGIRGSPSSQPWIESNLWLVRSFAFVSPSRVIWISSQFENASAIDYERAVADAAAACGRWIVSLDDALRTKMRARDPSALETWQRVSSYLKFAESYSTRRALAPYGNVGIVVDSASTKQDASEEYLNLVTRRQVPYQLVARSGLNAVAVAKLRALVATELDPPSAVERKMLQDFSEDGGLVIVGPSWGDAPKTEPFAEIPAGKGRLVVYKDPDPETVARDLKEILSDDDLGVVPFNVPSVITMASGRAPGQPLLVQLVNYFDHPVEAITLRVTGRFHSARFETPEAAAMELPLRYDEGRTEVTIPRLLLWGAVSME